MKTNFLCCLTGTVLLTGRLHAGDLIAHEWGTFTCVQGSDGTVLEWNPVRSSELPNFVYHRSHPLSAGGGREDSLDDLKSVQMWTQRLETPVVYFYGTEAGRIDFKVNFPKGVITEWYPQLSAFGPTPQISKAIPASHQSFARWDNLQLLGQSSPKYPEDAPKRDGSGNHYYAARETDSRLLRTESPIAGRKGPETEKFIFYRGAGNFVAPLRVRLDRDGTVSAANEGSHPLRHLFILNVKGQRAKYAYEEELGGNLKREITFPIESGLEPIQDVVGRLEAQMEKGLIAEGLYPSEAKAMVKTWRDSWFTEDGVRVLYLLPREWTDEILPVTISPAPKELVRVMVGRAEVFSPKLEDTLRGIYSDMRDPGLQPAAVAKLSALKLGRFDRAALTRLETLEKEAVAQQIGALRVSLNSKNLTKN